MDKPNPNTCQLLVIGYGNELRGDDAAGPKVAASVERLSLPGVRVIACHQLTPDLAEPISRAQSVIFVDADATGRAQLEVRPVHASDAAEVSAHESNPASLLALAQELYGRRPAARLLVVPAQDFEFGEQLSSATRDGIDRAVQEIRALAVPIASVDSP